MVDERALRLVGVEGGAAELRQGERVVGEIRVGALGASIAWTAEVECSWEEFDALHAAIRTFVEEGRAPSPRRGEVVWVSNDGRSRLWLPVGGAARLGGVGADVVVEGLGEAGALVEVRNEGGRCVVERLTGEVAVNGAALGERARAEVASRDRVSVGGVVFVVQRIT